MSLIGVFRSAGPIRHIHIETNKPLSNSRYAVIIYHDPHNAKIATALSRMMVTGCYITATLVQSCTEILPYSSKMINDVLLEHRQQWYFHSKIPQVSIFDSAPSMPLTMSKIDLLTTPYPYTSSPPSDCVDPGSKLEEDDNNAKHLLELNEKVVLRGGELDDRRLIADCDVSNEENIEEETGDETEERKLAAKEMDRERGAE
ncbi:hypothetical protein E3P96_03398 [Wallemia ichthyophaga]|nr:hypothetical protein E3P96_03398 [Wallemia ichthyophaga]